MKKIWYIGRGNFAEPGTAQVIHSTEDVKGLNQHGFKTTLFTSCYDHKTHSDDRSLVFVTTRKRKFEKFLFELKMIWFLTTNPERPNFVIYRGPTNLFLSAFVLKQMGIPFGVELNGVMAYRYEKKLSLFQMIEKHVDRFMMDSASVVFAVTQELENLAHRETNSETVTALALNGVNTSIIKPVTPRPQKGSFNIGFLGKAFQSRGLKIALAVIQILKEREIEINLKCVGGGPKIKELQDDAKRLKIHTNLTCVDAVLPEEMASVTAECDLMWASFEDWDRYNITGLSPLKIWTYLAIAKPVFIRDPASVLGVYRDVPGLIWTKENSPAGLADHLEWIIQNYTKSELVSLGQEGRNYVEKNISWKKHAGKMADGIGKALEFASYRI